MFQQLLESNVVHRPRWGGSALSTIAHVAAITAAVALSAGAHESRVEEPAVPLHFVPVATPAVSLPRVAPPPRGTASSNSAASTTTTPTSQLNIDIALDVAALDFTRVAMSDDEFARLRPVGNGGSPDGIPGGRGLASPTGAWLAEQVDKPVFLAPGSPAPAYPEMLRTAGIAGSVMVEFVVDTLGRVESGSGHVLSADHELFAASARAILPRLRFLPAEAQGRKVRQLVRLPFRFDLHS